jgi:hypothetical protein
MNYIYMPLSGKYFYGELLFFGFLSKIVVCKNSNNFRTRGGILMATVRRGIRDPFAFYNVATLAMNIQEMISQLGPFVLGDHFLDNEKMDFIDNWVIDDPAICREGGLVD